MPSSSSMTPEQMIDLVHYIRSLSTEEQQQSAVLKRERIVVAKVDRVAPTIPNETWDLAKPVQLRLTPLWWRNDEDAGFTVRAIHDVKTIAFNLTWNDKTANNESLHSESFKDAVAVELYRGPAEPFLGMGSQSSPVDVWFWDADRQNDPTAVEQSHPNAVADAYPFSEATVASPELTRPAARMKNQPDISLPARERQSSRAARERLRRLVVARGRSTDCDVSHPREPDCSGARHLEQRALDGGYDTSAIGRVVGRWHFARARRTRLGGVCRLGRIAPGSRWAKIHLDLARRRG